MRTLLFLICSFLFLVENVHGQILTSSPAFPTQTDQITIYYNATSGNAALTGFVPIYAHTGCITNVSTGPNDWQHVVGNWGQADPTVVMTPMGNNVHRIIITPQTFYNLNVGETISQLKFVFRNQSGSAVGRNADQSDIYLNIYQSGFNAAIQTPTATSSLIQAGSNNTITCASSIASNLSLAINGSEVASQTNTTSLSYVFSSNVPGEYQAVFTAELDGNTASDTVQFIIVPAVTVANPPAGTTDGINYLGNGNVLLQLYAPNKDFVFVVGDFNNWTYDLNYFMNRTPDGTTYWIEIAGLQSNVEYGFQYSIDAEGLRVADVYSDKILDQWNDSWISQSIYPNIKPYPYGLTSEPVSVLEINQPTFNWSDQNFQRTGKEKLVVYELLIRDFLDTESYANLMDTLNYLETLGITAIQLMPINEFEGNNSWGYNPSFYFAPDKAYGSEESLKAFVNAAHNKGIAVIMDIALNHSFGQNPMVRMYFDPSAGTYGQPSAENPWFNQTAKHDFNVGYDFNHESTRTRSFCKRVLGYWLSEYHIDGYRFDLSKGFTQNYTLGNIAAWGAYDQSRVNILTDYYNHIQNTESGAYVILEHFADNSEETVLANTGMMLWGNMAYNYEEASMGYSGDLNWGSYQNRGWSQPNLVTYAESHDEERMMFKNVNYGATNGSYAITSLNTALARQEMAHCFLLPLPGPKMIYQFGELGYDYSLNTCPDLTISNNCRTDQKPLHWDYLDNPNRLHLYKVTSALNHLKKDYQTFSTTNYTYDANNKGKRLILDGATMDAVIVGNFDVIGISMIPGFTHTGTWYDYFTGNPVQVNGTGDYWSFAAGEYHLYTDQPLPLPDLSTCALEGQSCNDNNPATMNDVYTSQCVCAGILIVNGCTSSEACNYNALANVDDGSCLTIGATCNDDDANTINDVINLDCVCLGEAIWFGCMDINACNYELQANMSDNSCQYTGTPCDDGDNTTINDTLSVNCVCEGILFIPGCLALEACNYNPEATDDDGSCAFVGDSCDDGDFTTILDTLSTNCECVGIIIGIAEGPEMQVQLYPNPTQTNWTLRWSNSQPFGLKLYDQTGRIVWSGKANGAAVTVPGETLPSGVYQLHWMENQRIQHLNLVKL